MLVLEEKGLQGYGNKFLSFLKGDHKSEEIMKLNPRGQLPTFKHGDIVLNDSFGIMHYLETIFKNQGTKLLPKDPKHLALVLQKTYESLNLQKIHNEDLAYVLLGFRPGTVLTDEQIVERKQKIRDELQKWENHLAQLGDGSFIGGPDFTMADVTFIPQIAFVFRMGVSMEARYPYITKYYNMICERPSVKASWPPHWKENESKNVLADL